MVQLISTTGLAALASLFVASSGHMIMKTPTPFSVGLNNSPLDASGSDFPCKQRDGTYASPPTNIMAIGEPQTLSFTGSAVHGGGSCQISLSTDAAPTADTKDWSVIHSIEGGCPSGASGNLDGGPDSSDPTTFQYSIPEGIEPGNYTLAWTWFNKVGNREMYMNCAPITVTAGASKKRSYPPMSKKRDTAFPAMAVANAASVNSCATPDSKDITFETPGTSVEKSSSGTFAAMTGSECTVKEAKPFGSSGSSGSSSASSAAASAPASSAPAASSASSASSAAITQSSGGVFATVSASAPAASPTAAESSASVEAPTAATSASAPASTGSSSGTTSTGNGTAAQGASCSTEGQTDCAADGQSYMICASGYWQSMPVAAGTQCTAGMSDSIKIAAVPVKRDHVRQHLRRHSPHH